MTSELTPEYERYMNSPAWRDLKRRYRESSRPQFCVICKDRDYQLHHLTYDRLGHESFDDLVALCSSCHKYAHQAILDREYRMLRKGRPEPKSISGVRIPAGTADALLAGRQLLK